MEDRPAERLAPWSGACSMGAVRRVLTLFGVLALFAWTGLGLLAWTSVGQRVTLLNSDDESAARQADEARLRSLEDELTALHQDVRALATAMGENLQALSDGLEASQKEHAAETQLRIAALRDEVGSHPADSPSSDELADLRRELRDLREALRATADLASAAQLVPSSSGAVRPEPEVAVQPAAEPAPEVPAPIHVAAAEPEPQVEAPAAPPAQTEAPRKKSFLAFRLPSDDFRFDERRTWTILPALSRVGFDAKTTLHDFTATSSTIEGQLEADLSRPTETPRARVSVRAESLASGNGDRDDAMREHLAVDRFTTLDFELTKFEPAEIDVAARTASGRATGHMTIRGVTQDVTMPVQISLDESRRLCVTGEMPLDLTRFDVPVPNKLGLITMEKEVKVWISLRLRVEPRSEG